METAFLVASAATLAIAARRLFIASRAGQAAPTGFLLKLGDEQGGVQARPGTGSLEPTPSSGAPASSARPSPAPQPTRGGGGGRGWMVLTIVIVAAAALYVAWRVLLSQPQP